MFVSSDKGAGKLRMPTSSALLVAQAPLGWSEPPSTLETLATCIALVLVPLAVGWLAGFAIRRLRGARFGGVLAVFAAMSLLVVLTLVLNRQLALLGVWDAGMIGVLLAAGMLMAAHRVFADPRNIALSVAAGAVGLLAVEVASRWFLPAPPAFPTQDGPQLLLSDAVRASARSGMSAILNQEIACQLVYAPTLRGPLTPQGSFHPYSPRAGVRRRVVHLGDSIVAGSVPDGRFTDNLGTLEPDVEHVNASICATAPDAHFVLARRWVSEQAVDAVVVHLNPNDSLEIDDPYPCAGWRSLLVYDGDKPRLRYTTSRPDDQPGRFRLLLGASPPPYLLRATLRSSAAAAHLAAACVQFGRRVGYSRVTDHEVGLAHIEMILRTLRDELNARRVALVAVILHFRPDVEAGFRQTLLRAIPEALGIVTLDTWEPMIQSLQAGEQLFTNAGGPTDSHFNANGHAMMAKWLHAELPAAIERAGASFAPATPGGSAQ